MSYTSLLVHCVFATKERRPLITKEMQPKLWAYMGGIARTNGIRALAIGGVKDHVHLLLSLSSTMPVAKAIQLIKAGSSKWFNEQTRPGSFEWQGRIRRIHNRNLSIEGDNPIHRQPGEASP